MTLVSANLARAAVNAMENREAAAAARFADLSLIMRERADMLLESERSREKREIRRLQKAGVL